MKTYSKIMTNKHGHLSLKSPVLLVLFLLILLLVATAFKPPYSAHANFIPPRVPSPAIIVRSDGSIYPPTAPIQRVGDVYTFKGNISSYTIVIQRNNVVIDGAGYTLQGNRNSTGVFLQSIQNVVIRNLAITGFLHGVWFTWGPSMDQGAMNNTVTNNTITNNTRGVNCPLFTSANIITNNTITDNQYGIYLAYSPNNVLRNNSVYDNQYNLWVDCLLSHQGSAFINDIDTSNTVDGKPVYYWVGEKDQSIPYDAGYVALVHCSNITVQGLNLSHNGQGVLLVETNGSKITGNSISENNYGVALFGMYSPCTNNIITKNRVSQNTENIYAYLEDSMNIIEDNTPSTTIPTPTPSPSPKITQNPPSSPIPTASPMSMPMPTASFLPSLSHSMPPLTSNPPPAVTVGDFGMPLLGTISVVSVVIIGVILLVYLKHKKSP